jgi:hypothetical protein
MSKEQTKFNWDKAPIICNLNGTNWILGPEADEELDWKSAKAWCTSVGGELPPREILLLASMNQATSDWFGVRTYWSSSELSATTAWFQTFSNSTHNFNYKTSNYYVRAVRRVDI